MSPTWQSVLLLVALLASMAAYALFVGADFGGGMWDILAGGTQRGARPRSAIDQSVTPVWEGNQTWIVFGLVILWTAYPLAFAATMTTLFVPLALSLLGLLLRGVGFAFRHEAETLRGTQLNGALFGASSVIAPFFLGVSVGAVATGVVRPEITGENPFGWVAPVPLVTGVLFVAACSYIGAVYLVGDSWRRGQHDLVDYFARRSLASGVVTGGIAAVNLALLTREAPYVSRRLLGMPGLPLVLLSVGGGLVTLGLVVLRERWLPTTRRTWPLRVGAAVAVGSVIAAWGAAQYPWLLPRTLTLAAGSAPVTSLDAELVVVALAGVLVVPAFAVLYWLQQRGDLSAEDPGEGPAGSGAPTTALADSLPSDRAHSSTSRPKPWWSRWWALAGAGAAILVADRASRRGVRDGRRKPADQGRRRSR